MKFDGKVALVTGASSGIGLAVAEGFVRGGGPERRGARNKARYLARRRPR